MQGVNFPHSKRCLKGFRENNRFLALGLCLICRQRQEVFKFTLSLKGKGRKDKKSSIPSSLQQRLHPRYSLVCNYFSSGLLSRDRISSLVSMFQVLLFEMFHSFLENEKLQDILKKKPLFICNI